MSANPQNGSPQTRTQPSTYKKVALCINVATVVLVVIFGFYLWLKH